jgi:hypothetical protein
MTSGLWPQVSQLACTLGERRHAPARAITPPSPRPVGPAAKQRVRRLGFPYVPLCHFGHMDFIKLPTLTVRAWAWRRRVRSESSQYSKLSYPGVSRAPGACPTVRDDQLRQHRESGSQGLRAGIRSGASDAKGMLRDLKLDSDEGKRPELAVADFALSNEIISPDEPSRRNEAPCIPCVVIRIRYLWIDWFHVCDRHIRS